MEIYAKLAQVMDEVGAVRKTERNTNQQFNFRGIDAVVNAVSPALRKHGVVVVPSLHSIDYQTVEVGQNRTRMGHVRVQVSYTFAAADGSQVAAFVAAEAMDSGDKATAKAMSVAFRTALLQTLCLPTDETDPDAQSYERSPAQAKKPQQQPKPQADAAAPTTSAKPRAEVGGKAKPVSAGNGQVSEQQIGLMHTLTKALHADDKLLSELADGRNLQDLSKAEASAIIEDLLAIKRGSASLAYNQDGKVMVIHKKDN